MSSLESVDESQLDADIKSLKEEAENAVINPSRDLDTLYCTEWVSAKLAVNILKSLPVGTVKLIFFYSLHNASLQLLGLLNVLINPVILPLPTVDIWPQYVAPEQPAVFNLNCT